MESLIFTRPSAEGLTRVAEGLTRAESAGRSAISKIPFLCSQLPPDGVLSSVDNVLHDQMMSGDDSARVLALPDAPVRATQEPARDVRLGKRSGVALASWCLCLVLTQSFWPGVLVAEETSSEAAPVIPRPVLSKRADLPSVFRKDVPASIENLKAMEKHIEKLAARVSPAVVAVRVGFGAGTGVVVSKDGLVLCAAHVGGEPNRDVRFTFPDGRTTRGKTLGTDHGMDSGLMQITDIGPWPYADIGDLEDVRLGDWVLALGHPGGFDPDRSMVVRLGRIIWRAGMLQTDCTITAGDSGGPLFDMRGRVIGIHSRISNSAAGNFHVPIGTYVETWDRLAKGESWGDERPAPLSTVGVRGVNDPDGCRLEMVYDDGPGFKAGLKPGDIVLSVNGEKIPDSDALVQRVRAAKPGEEATFVIKRDGEQMSLKVKVETRRGRWRPRP